MVAKATQIAHANKTALSVRAIHSTELNYSAVSTGQTLPMKTGIRFLAEKQRVPKDLILRLCPNGEFPKTRDK